MTPQELAATMTAKRLDQEACYLDQFESESAVFCRVALRALAQAEREPVMLIDKVANANWREIWQRSAEGIMQAQGPTLASLFFFTSQPTTENREDRP